MRDTVKRRSLEEEEVTLEANQTVVTLASQLAYANTMPQ